MVRTDLIEKFGRLDDGEIFVEAWLDAEKHRVIELLSIMSAAKATKREIDAVIDYLTVMLHDTRLRVNIGAAREYYGIAQLIKDYMCDEECVSFSKVETDEGLTHFQLRGEVNLYINPKAGETVPSADLARRILIDELIEELDPSRSRRTLKPEQTKLEGLSERMCQLVASTIAQTLLATTDGLSEPEIDRITYILSNCLKEGIKCQSRTNS